MPSQPARPSSFREYPKVVKAADGGPDKVAWNDIEEAEIATGKKRPPPPTIKVPIKRD